MATENHVCVWRNGKFLVVNVRRNICGNMDWILKGESQRFRYSIWRDYDTCPVSLLSYGEVFCMIQL